ncbi:MAG: phosphatase PAP2 family protein [Burkholderia sp.]|nr:phosphatase PAP2 family protein [Burkholderia sp.]
MNFKLFFAINSGLTPQPDIAKLVSFIANWIIYIIPTMLLLAWLISVQSKVRYQMIEAFFSSFVALIAAQIFSLVWFSPSLFIVNISSPKLLTHIPPYNSFPSDHMTFAWSIAFSLLICSTTRALGAVMTIIGVAIGWARIYIGAHWPFDIVGGILVGMLGALIVHLYMKSVIILLSRIGEKVHETIIKSFKTTYRVI